MVGLNISLEALKYIATNRACGSITRLPFAPGSFDLVMANDVMEHIPERDYRESLLELHAAASRYILIAVPFMEILDGFLTRCGVCSRRYHINHHYRSFGIAELKGLLPEGWKPTTFVFSGLDLTPYEIFSRYLRAILGITISSETAICPWCGARASLGAEQTFQSLIDILAQHVSPQEALFHPHRSECLVLYERKSPCPSETEPTLRISYSRNGSEASLPANPVATEEEMIVEAPDLPHPIPPSHLWLEWKCGGIGYRYPRPISLSNHKFQLPLWFSPHYLEHLSASRAFWSDREGAQFLFQAVRSLFPNVPQMQKEIELRKGFRGAWRTILERLGIGKIGMK